MKGLALLAAAGTSVLFGFGSVLQKAAASGSSLSGGLMRACYRACSVRATTCSAGL